MTDMENDMQCIRHILPQDAGLTTPGPVDVLLNAREMDSQLFEQVLSRAVYFKHAPRAGGGLTLAPFVQKNTGCECGRELGEGATHCSTCSILWIRHFLKLSAISAGS